MRLIDADEVVRAVHDEFDECLVWDESGATTANEFENIILQIPTVDAVEVIRCKDCVFFHRYGFKLEYTECRRSDCHATEDGYCCWAERREDGESD